MRNVTEDMFIGSLIATDDRPIGYAHFIKSDIAPAQITDKQNRAIFQAVRFCQNKYNQTPTAENIVTVMALEGLLENLPTEINEAAERRAADIKGVQAYLGFAAKNEKAFSTIETQLNLQHRQRALNKFARQDAPAIVADPVGSLPEKADALQQELNKINSGWQATSSVFYQPDQETELKRFVLEQRQAIDQKKKMMTLPPEWGKLNTTYVKYVKKSLMYVVKGPTKAGKSSAMGQWADWAARDWKVAYFALEDDYTRSAIRQTCRNIPGTDSDILYRGDPNNDFDKMMNLRKIWQRGGGNFIFVHCPGRSAAWIIQQINNIQQAFGLDIVFIDYLQKIATKGDQKFDALSESVEVLRQRAEEPGKQIAVVLGSQITADADGGTHTRGTRDLEQKAQCIISIRPKKAKEDEIYGGKLLAGKGDMSVFSDLVVELYNDGQAGGEELIFLRPQFKFVARDWRDKQNVQMAAPALTYPTQYDVDRIAKNRAAWESI